MHLRVKRHLSKVSKGVFKRPSTKPFTHPPPNQVSTPFRPSPFSILPAELCISILTDAAKFSQFEVGREENPYSTALALCRVSRTARSIVLPELLRTILLSRSKNVFAFTHALNMQKWYGLEGNDLYVHYPSHVRNIWIGETSSREHRSIDVSLLAPVLFAAKSLALDIGSIPLLDRCLTQAWEPPTRFKFFKRREFLRLDWSTTTLTLVGNLESYQPSTRYAAESLRAAFFASIPRFMFLPPISFRFALGSGSEGGVGCAQLPAPGADKFPWTSLKSPQTTVLACPVAALPSPAFSTSGGDSAQLSCRDVKALPVPGLLKVHAPSWDKIAYSPHLIKHPPLLVITVHVEWEQTWACRLSDEEPSKLADGLVELSDGDFNINMTSETV